MAGIVTALLTALVGYLLGSISSSIIITKLFIKKDIRSFGSGNAGATNVLRAVGKTAAALTFVFDFLKCVAAVMAGRLIYAAAASMGYTGLFAEYGVYFAGVCCFIGHIYPLYFHVRGGKGVVTAAAMIALTDWRVFLLLVLVFFGTFFIWRYVSLSSVLAAFSYPVLTFAVTYLVDYTGGPLQGDKPLDFVLVATAVAVLMGGIVVWKHRENIKRLREGTEKKIYFSQTKR
ncbi:MAG: glycerol-3-phosphate 1-O-acyltransferase PlsY [Clostridia bacterium]|nr:glycerol-3-phosphate 1-O-acyltransferase PlsY [Clostridia bacterium]